MKAISAELGAFLDEHDIEYEIIPHRTRYTAQEIAADTHTPGKEFAKTVILQINGEYAMAVLPAHHVVDCEQLAHNLGVDHVRLASEDEIRILIHKFCPECETGAIPPFGNLYGLPVYVSRPMLEDDSITFNAGTLESVVRMSFADFQRLVKPEVLEFSRLIAPAPRRHPEIGRA